MEQTKYIAHRGFAQRATENTIEAFEIAAKSTAYGIETDVRITLDKKVVCFHDESTLRLCGEEHIVEDTTLEKLETLKINGKHKIPTLEEYINICKSGDKYAIIELKRPFDKQDIAAMIEQIHELDYLHHAVFISFDMQICQNVKKISPDQCVQLVTDYFNKELVEQLGKQKIDIDMQYTCLSQGRIKFCHSHGVKVNCWTLNDAKIAKHLEQCGIDFITSDNLENSGK